MENSTFKKLGLNSEIIEAVEARGYASPSPIQKQAIPEILAGRDIFGCAQTGTGKTAAFALPILQKLSESPKYVSDGQFRSLILVPTRELAEQVADNAAYYAKFLDLKILKIYGGVSQNAQIRGLKKGIDLLIATPGRLLDLFKQHELSFDAVEILVLDEADRMLDMGFINDIRKICSRLPKDRQSLLFSATLEPEVKELAQSIVRNPVEITIEAKSPTVDKIDQKLCFVEKDDKIALLKHILEEKIKPDNDAIALIFCRTKHGANRVAKRFSGGIFDAAAIHGNKSQSSRKNSLDRFKRRESRILVATDIAARGIDVKAMSLVINYELPEEPETYVHRIGRTARAEAHGEAISFCSSEEVGLLNAIERFIKKEIPLLKNNPYASLAAEELKNSGKKVVFKRPQRQPNPNKTKASAKPNEKKQDPKKDKADAPKSKWNWRFNRGKNKAKKS